MVDLGTGPLTSAGGRDGFLVSYDSTGTPRWARRFGGVENDIGWATAIDGAGNTAVAGSFRQTVDIGTGPLTSAGSHDLFLASYDGTGAPRWAQRFGDTAWDTARDLVVDGGGNLLVTGYFLGPVDFGTGPLNSAGGEEMFLASYRGDGTPRWSRRFGGAANDRGLGVAVHASGAIAAAGEFQGTGDFGTGPLTAAGGIDGFVLLLSP